MSRISRIFLLRAVHVEFYGNAKAIRDDRQQQTNGK